MSRIRTDCLKHVEFYSENKFEELVHLVGFIIRIYHDAWSPERPIYHDARSPEHPIYHDAWSPGRPIYHDAWSPGRPIYHDARSPGRQIANLN